MHISSLLKYPNYVMTQISSVSAREGKYHTARSDGEPENISDYFTINCCKWTHRLNLILLKLTSFFESHWRLGYMKVFFRWPCSLYNYRPSDGSIPYWRSLARYLKEFIRLLRSYFWTERKQRTWFLKAEEKNNHFVH
jgi:hypothetical protein